jgi:hypothetical protein
VLGIMSALTILGIMSWKRAPKKRHNF